MDTLGQGISTLYNNTLSLYLAATDPQDRARIQGELSTLNASLQKLIDSTLNQEDADYKAAVTATNAANEAVKQALNGLAGIAAAINKLAQAIALIGKVAAMA
jgi:hypothetical protein